MKYFLLASLMFVSVYVQAQTNWKIVNGELQLSRPIEFVGSTAQLTPESEVPLREVAAYLNAKDYITLMRIEGHANTQELSEYRAMAVSKWLIAHGIDCKRIIAVGFGDTKPISEDKAANTRISAVNAALKGRAIGGMPVDGGGKVAGDLCP